MGLWSSYCLRVGPKVERKISCQPLGLTPVVIPLVECSSRNVVMQPTPESFWILLLRYTTW